jgi:phage FluMu protein Com
MYQFNFIWKELSYITNEFISEQKGSIQTALDLETILSIASKYQITPPREILSWFTYGNGQQKPSPFWENGLWWYDVYNCFEKIRHFNLQDTYPIAEDKEGNIYSVKLRQVDSKSIGVIHTLSGENLNIEWVLWAEEKFRTLVSIYILPLLFSKEKSKRESVYPYAKWTTYIVSNKKMIVESWKNFEVNSSNENWRLIEGDIDSILKTSTTPAELNQVKVLYDSYDFEKAEIPPKFFWLGLSVFINKPEHYYSKTWVLPWLNFWKNKKNVSIIKSWLDSNDLDCLAFLAFSPVLNIQKKAFKKLEGKQNSLDAIWATIRRLGSLIQPIVLEKVKTWILKSFPNYKEKAVEWLEDSNENSSSFAASFILDEELSLLCKAKGNLKIVSLLARNKMNLESWKKILIQTNYPFLWLKSINEFILKNKFLEIGFSEEDWISILVEVTTQNQSIHYSDRHRILALLKNYTFLETDSNILTFTLPLFPLQSLERDVTNQIEFAISLLSTYFEYATTENKKLIVKLIDSYQKIQCAFCNHLFTWQESYWGPSVKCPNCGDKVLEEVLKSFCYVGNHKKINLFKKIPKVKQYPYNPID